MWVMDIWCAIYGIWVCESPASSVDSYREVRVEAKLHIISTPYYVYLCYIEHIASYLKYYSCVTYLLAIWTSLLWAVNIFNIFSHTYVKFTIYWPSVLRNTSKARQVWGWLRKLLLREGADPTVLEKFYRAVLQAVLLFGADILFVST